MHANCLQATSVLLAARCRCGPCQVLEKNMKVRNRQGEAGQHVCHAIGPCHALHHWQLHALVVACVYPNLKFA